MLTRSHHAHTLACRLITPSPARSFSDRYTSVRARTHSQRLNVRYAFTRIILSRARSSRASASRTTYRVCAPTLARPIHDAPSLAIGAGRRAARTPRRAPPVALVSMRSRLRSGASLLPLQLLRRRASLYSTNDMKGMRQVLGLSSSGAVHALHSYVRAGEGASGRGWASRSHASHGSEHGCCTLRVFTYIRETGE